MKEKYIVYFVSKTKKKMVQFIDRELKKNNLDDLVPSYGNILTALYENGGSMGMKDIGDLIGKEKSTITALVGRLEKLGYVEKIKSTDDKRVTYVNLTSKGRAIEAKFEEISEEVQRTAYKDFSEDEKRELLRLLKKLNRNFDGL